MDKKEKVYRVEIPMKKKGERYSCAGYGFSFEVYSSDKVVTLGIELITSIETDIHKSIETRIKEGLSPSQKGGINKEFPFAKKIRR